MEPKDRLVMALPQEVLGSPDLLAYWPRLARHDNPNLALFHHFVVHLGVLLSRRVLGGVRERGLPLHPVTILICLMNSPVLA